MYESGEMYLETILLLTRENANIRSIDVAKELDFSKSSVSRAIGLLKEDDYISISPEGFIELTQKGLVKAENIYDKHTLLARFFKDVIKVSPKVAEEDACKIEHFISDETFNCLKKYMDRII